MPVQRSKIREWEPVRLPETAELRDVIKAYNKLVYQYVNTLTELTTKFNQMEDFGVDPRTGGRALYGYRTFFSLSAGASTTITHSLGYVPGSFIVLYDDSTAGANLRAVGSTWTSTTAEFSNNGTATGFWNVWVY